MQRERRKNNDILFHFRKDGLPMTKLSQLKIDPEFQNQINPPSFEETHQLEMSILKEERVLNPIITWNGYIVDGHTRYQILRKYPFIPFEVIEKEFSSRYEALVWICKNQLGRRNLTPEQKKFLIGKQAEAEKQIKSFHGNQYTLASESGLVQNEPDRTKHGSRSKVAAEHGTSESYVYRAEQFAKGVEAAEEAVPGAQKEILSGKIRATDREISSIAKVLKVTAKEFDLLEYFVKHKGMILSRDKILDSVWGFDYIGGYRSVDTLVKKLRAKLTKEYPYIKTVYGVGYCFDV